MPKYLALYKASGSGHEQGSEPTPEQQQAMMQAWFTWKENAGDAIVDFGAPTTAVPGGGGSDIGGYSIVQADTADELDAVFETNPHRKQGGTVEYHQIVDIPGA